MERFLIHCLYGNSKKKTVFDTAKNNNYIHEYCIEKCNGNLSIVNQNI